MAGKRKEKKERTHLVVLDAHAIIHRAYHALPEFTSGGGEPTGALYGLAAMLLKIVQELKPDYIVAAYDLKGGTHRHDVFEAYKATRKELDDSLTVQLERSRDVFKAFGIAMYDAKGFEADDVIGTIAEQLKDREDVQVTIASGDMDTLQLVDNDRVRVYTLRKGLADTVLYDEQAVRERFGFGPELIPDYKGLRGDPSDNIPGVAGIGEKGATELVTQFGSLEDIFCTLKDKPEAFEEKGIRARVVKLLTEGEEDAAFSKMLATIRRDVPITFTLPSAVWREAVDPQDILTFFSELGFRTLADRVRKFFGVDEERTEQSDEDIDERALTETCVALWLLNSDTTNPTLDDVLRFAQTNQFSEAQKTIFAKLKGVGRLREVFETIEQPLIPVVARMSDVGVKLDVAYLEQLSSEYHTVLDGICARVYKHAGTEFNINSPKQLGDVLFDTLGLTMPKQKKTGTGQRSTRESELEKISDAHPIVEEVLAYRELQKLLSTYIDALPKLADKRGRVHAQFLQAGTTTGRMASQNPNMQNIPIRSEYGRKIRNAFVAQRGSKLVVLDYSQIELRIAAALSGDEKLQRVFREGGDVHTTVASEVFGVPPSDVDAEMRRRAKVINFGILYGMGVNALRMNLGDEVTRNEASAYLSDYFTTFTGLAEYVERTKRTAAKQGFTETFFGRRRYFAGFESSLPHVRASAERMAINAPIQGTQADIIKLAMVRVHEMLEREGLLDAVRVVLQVHDELVYEVHSKYVADIAPRIKTIMEDVIAPEQFGGVPIVATVAQGSNWGELSSMGAI